MKSVLNFYMGLALVFLFFSCQNRSRDSVKNAKDSNAAKIDSLQTIERLPDSPVIAEFRSDADFLVNAASRSMMEVQLGHLAESNAAAQRVKAFGAMLVKDHEKADIKLKKLAAANNVTLPATVSLQQQNKIDALKKKKGDDFDRAYIRLVTDDQRSNIGAFEKQAAKGTDSLIRVFASSSLEMLRRHLDSAGNLRKALGIDDTKIIPPVP